jgi:hypothetical protein
MITLLPPYFAVVFIGSTIFALQQLSGINAVFYFSSTVFKSFGVPSDIANVCVGIANLSGMVGFTLEPLTYFLDYAYLFVYKLFMLPYLFWLICLYYSRVNCCNDIDG